MLEDSAGNTDRQGLLTETGLVAPSSFSQEAAWVLDQAGFPAGQVCRAFAFDAIEEDCLRRALDALARRHEILRTSFLQYEYSFRTSRPRRVVQIVAPEGRIELLTARLDSQGPCGDAIHRFVAGQLERPFDLAAGPLLRAALVSLGGGGHLLLLSAHRAALDGRSLEILARELRALCRTLAIRETPSTAPARQFTEFAGQQRNAFAPGVLEAQVAWWTGKLSGELPAIELPLDRPRRPGTGFRPGKAAITFPAAPLRALAGQAGVPLRVVVLAALETLLLRYSGSSDVLLAYRADARAELGYAEVPGPFSNILLLRTDFSGDPPFRTAAERAAEAEREALANTATPHETVLEKLGRDAAPWPVSFEWRTEAPEPAGLPFENGSDFAITAWADEEVITLDAVYNAEFLDAATANRMLGHLQVLLDSAAAAPGDSLSGLQMLPKSEQSALVSEWNRTEASYPACPVHELFEQQAARTPDAIAVECGGERLTYAQLNLEANRLAWLLIDAGAGPGTLVGIALERSTAMLVAVLGVLKSGAAYVALDPIYPRERLGFMIEDSGMRVLVTSTAVAGRLPAHRVRTVNLDKAAPARFPEANPDPRAKPEDLAYTIYTSGSTGRPKGVQILHRGVVNFLCAMLREPGLNASDTLLAVTTLCFDIAGLELYLPLTAGARVVIATSADAADANALQQLLAGSGATVMQATPATWRMLVDGHWQGRPGLKILCGGEALSRTLADQLLERCDSLWNLYGPTETTIWSTCCRVLPGSAPVTIGWPIANTQLYILDSHMRPVPAGVAGELYIGGDGLARGYHNRPELTAEKFVPDPFSGRPGDLMYQTGDVARRRPDGEIDFLGRSDHQVKIRGFRVELGEIETLLRQHPGVREAVVIAREDAPGARRLAAYLAPDEGPGPDAAALRRFLKEQLPDYMVPSAFVLLDAFPLTPNGKVDRRALPAPEVDRHDVASAFVAPRNATEARLSAIWEEVIGIRPIGIHDNYFDLGAESLQAARMFGEIGRRFGRNLSPTSLFDAPTIAALARLLETGDGVKRWTSLVPIRPSGSKPPLFCIHGGSGTVLFYYDLARHLGPDQPVYAIQNQGLYGGTAPHRSVPEMAAHYLNEIRTVQPRGPYRLAGYCFGISVAFEMARVLLREGEQVALLASLNGTTPGYVNGPGLGAAFTAPAPAGIRSWRAFVRARIPGLVWRLERPVFELCCTFGWPIPARLRERWFLALNGVAEHAYRPEPYPGSMVVFRSKGLYYDPCMGWGGHVKGGIETHDIPGSHRDHRDLMEEPIVGTLTEALKRYLP